MKASIDTFIETLSKWGNGLSGKGNDYENVLAVIAGSLGNLTFMSSDLKLSVEDMEKLVKDKLYAESEKISDSILVLGTTQFLTYWLNRSALSTIQNLQVFEEMKDERKIGEIKSFDYQYACHNEYYEWVKYATEYLGFDSVRIWENDRLLKKDF